MARREIIFEVGKVYQGVRIDGLENARKCPRNGYTYQVWHLCHDEPGLLTHRALVQRVRQGIEACNNCSRSGSRTDPFKVKYKQEFSAWSKRLQYQMVPSLLSVELTAYYSNIRPRALRVGGAWFPLLDWTGAGPGGQQGIPKGRTNTPAVGGERVCVWKGWAI